MIRLLRAGIRRYFSNIIFWIAVILTLGLSVLMSYQARNAFYDDGLVIGQMMINAIMISWIICREYKDGVFRNKIIIGHTRENIFMSELILAIGFTLVMYFIGAIIYLVFNNYQIPLIPASVMIKMTIDYVLSNMVLTAFLVTTSYLLSHQVVVIVVNILIILGMFIVVNPLQVGLSQSQHIEMYETVNTEWIDDDGNIRYKEVKVEGSEYLVENPSYVDGIKRIAYEFVVNVAPYGHLYEYAEFSIDWFGYDVWINNPTEGLTGEEQWQLIIEDNVITDDYLKNLDINLIYSCITLLVISSIGYIGFRKKEMK